MKLYWLDIETTGLDPMRHRILEVAVAEADLARPFDIQHRFHAVLGIGEIELGRLDKFIVDMHTHNGLLHECLVAPRTIGDIEDDLIDLLPDVVNDKDERPTLAGSSIHFDLAFLRVHAPRFAARLSHRLYDVSSVKLFCQSLGMPKFPKAEAHRAIDDINESVAHALDCARWLRRAGAEQRVLRECLTDTSITETDSPATPEKD